MLRFQSTCDDSEFSLRDKRLLLDTWYQSGLQDNVLGNQFSTFDLLRDRPQRIHPCAPRETEDRARLFFGRDDKQIRGTIPMPRFAGRPSTMRS